LNAWSRQPTPAARAAIARALRRASLDAREYDAVPPDTTSAHRALETVLARSEFRGVHGPTLLERLTARAIRWLAAFLDRLIQTSSVPTIRSLVVYALIGLAIVLVGVALYRTLRATSDVTPVAVYSRPDDQRPWTVWLGAAQNAAAGGNWRDAIRLAHWCGVTFLEQKGAWRPDPSRTPREYLGLVAPTEAYGPALRALTERSERVWYGTDTADAARFGDALIDLRTLGCPIP
jgi:hypothetical protein